MNYTKICIVLERVCSFNAGAIMKKFAGVDFDLYDIDALTPPEMQHIKNMFLNNYSHISNYHIFCSRGIKIVEHLENYLQLQFKPDKNPDETMAKMLKCLPCYSQYEKVNIDYVLMNLLREVFKKYRYKDADYAQRLDMVQHEKKLISFTDDWESGVHNFLDSARRQNMEVAYGMLEEFEMMLNQINRDSSKEHAAYIVSIQIVIYIQILEYLNANKHRCSSYETSIKIDRFRDVVHADVVESIRGLLKILELTKVSNPKQSWGGMLFSFGVKDNIPHIVAQEQKKHAKIRNAMQAL